MGKSREKLGKTLQKLEKLETIRKPTKNEGVWQKNGNYLLCFLDLKVFFLCRVKTNFCFDFVYSFHTE